MSTPQERIDAARSDLQGLAAVLPLAVAQDLLTVMSGSQPRLPREHLLASLRAATASAVEPYAPARNLDALIPATAGNDGLFEQITAPTEPATPEVGWMPGEHESPATAVEATYDEDTLGFEPTDGELRIIGHVRATSSTNGIPLNATERLRANSVLAWIPRQGTTPGRWVLPREIAHHAPVLNTDPEFYSDVCTTCGLHQTDPVTHPEGYWQNPELTPEVIAEGQQIAAELDDEPEDNDADRGLPR